MNAERTFPSSRKKLLEAAKNTLAVMLQFKEQLAVKGIDQQYYDAMTADLVDVAGMKTGDALSDEASAQTAKVKTKCKACHKWGMRIKTYLQREFGKKGTEVNEFPTSFEVFKLDEAGMINTLPQVIALAKKYESALSKKGMEAGAIKAGETLLAELDELNKEQALMKTENDAYGVERRIAQLKLYDEINYVNSIGREVFEADAVKLKYFASPWKVKGNGKEEVKEAPKNNTPA